MATILIKIFFVGFFINLLYELLHSLLYKTCLEAPLKKYIFLILKAAIFDGATIVIIYFVAYKIFFKPYQLIAFSIISLTFAYIWEIRSLKKKKWKYSDKMPLILGIGITPFVQLALTGLLSIYIVAKFFI